MNLCVFRHGQSLCTCRNIHQKTPLSGRLEQPCSRHLQTSPSSCITASRRRRNLEQHSALDNAFRRIRFGKLRFYLLGTRSRHSQRLHCAKALQGYSSQRTYHLECHCLVPKKANMVVQTEYARPNRKEFTIESESGSRTVRRRFLNAFCKRNWNPEGGEQATIRAYS